MSYTICERCGYNILFPVTLIRKGVETKVCKKCHYKIQKEEEGGLMVNETFIGMLLDEQVDSGFVCQHCHGEIDGEETGRPRNCVPCESDNPIYEGER